MVFMNLLVIQMKTTKDHFQKQWEYYYMKVEQMRQILHKQTYLAFVGAKKRIDLCQFYCYSALFWLAKS